MTQVSVRDEPNDAGAVAWKKIQSKLLEGHGVAKYQSWFEPLHYERRVEDRIVLSAPVVWLRSWIQSHYASELLQRWRGEDDTVGDLRIVCRSALRPADGDANSSAAGAPNRAGFANGASAAPHRHADPSQPVANSAGALEGSPLEPRFTFASLVEGSANDFAVRAAKKIAFQQPGERAAFSPLYVCASVGLGKTHLLQAIAAAARGVNPARRTLYMTAEHFMYRFFSAIRHRSTLSFKDLLRDVDVLLIDDLQFLGGTKAQEEFGHTLTTLLDSQRQVVIAADRPPHELGGMDPRVVSRLSGGLMVEIGAPDYEMRREIVARRVAAQREAFEGLVFPEEIVDFVARSVTTNGRDLEGAVNRLVANNQLTGTAVDADLAEKILRDLMRARESKKPKIEDIQRVVCQHFGITKQDLLSARRQKTIVRPRQIAMWLCKQLTPRSLPEIGKRFGDKDHTTVLHAVKRIDELKATDKDVTEAVETLKRLLE